MRFIFGGFYLIFLSLISGYALAAPVEYEAVRAGSARYATTGVASPITVATRIPTAASVVGQSLFDNRFHQIVPVATKPVLGRLARSALRGGGIGLAVGFAIEGAGYLIDQATGEITKIETSTSPVVGDYYEPGPGSRYSWAGPDVLSDSAFSECMTYQYCVNQLNTSSNVRVISGWNCAPGDTGFNDYSLQQRCYTSYTGGEPVDEIVDLEPFDYEIIDDVIDDLPLDRKSRIISEVLRSLQVSGSVDTSTSPATITSTNPEVEQLYDDWPDLREWLRRVVEAEIARYRELTEPEFVPDEDERIIIDQGSPFPPMGSTDTDLPIFCQWAEFICRPFLDTEHPEMPELDLEEETYDSGLPSGGFCPLPYELELDFFGEYLIMFEPLCDFARGIRSFIIAISYLIAGFIVVGVRR